MKRQRAEISSNVISHIKSAHPIEMWRSNKLGIKEKISRGNFPRLIFSCPVPSGLPHRSHCVPMNMNPCGAWVSGISQSGLKNPAPDVNLPKSYNTRNQFEGNLTRVRIPPAAPKEEETHSRLFLFVLHLLPLLPPEVDSQHDRGVNQRGGEDNEREVALHLVARRRETLDE